MNDLHYNQGWSSKSMVKLLKGGTFAKFMDVIKLYDIFYFWGLPKRWAIGKIFNTETRRKLNIALFKSDLKAIFRMEIYKNIFPICKFTFMVAGKNHMWFFSIGGQHIFALPSWNVIKQNLKSVLHWVGITKSITKCQYTE